MMITRYKNRKAAAILAFAGAIVPISGLHKFYMGQPLWGIAYVLLSFTPFPKVAGVIEGLWYLFQGEEEFNRNFNPEGVIPAAVQSKPNEGTRPEQVGAIADALRHLEQLRQEGLISEYEFEQKRRQLLDRIA